MFPEFRRTQPPHSISSLNLNSPDSFSPIHCTKMPSYYDAVLSEFVPSYGWVYYELSSSQSDTGYPHSQDPSENQSQSNVGLETIQSYPHSVDDSAPSHHQLDAEHGYSPESEKADQFEPNHSTENCSFSDPGVYGEFGNRTTDQHPNLRFAGHSEQDLSAQRYERSANPSQSPRTFSEAAQPGPLEGIGTRFTMRTYPRPECLMTQQQGHHDPQSTLRYQNNEPCSAFSSGQQSDWNKGYPLPNTCKRTESPWSPEVMGGRNQQINVPVACRYSIGASEDSISGRNSSHGISGLPTDRDRATPTSSLNTSSTDIGQVAHLTETSLTSYYARDTLDASQSHEHCPISEAWAGQRQLNYLHSNDGAHTM